MKPSAAPGTLLMCIFLAIPMTVADVSFTFYYQCNNPPCKIIIWFSEYWLESFRDCLCSASTSACYVYYLYYQGYCQGYKQANRTYSLKINNNNYKYQAEFNCTIAYDIFNFQGNIQCYRSSTASENAFKSFQFTTDTNTCDFRCINIIPSHIYNINFDNNKIIKDSTATCRPHFNKTTTTETLTAQQQTTRAEPSITTSTATTALLSAVGNQAKFPDYNSSQTNTSAFGDTRNMQDNTIDTGLITGVITAIVAVIVIVLVIVLLWRRRINKSYHKRSKDDNKCTERPITASDPNAVILSGNNNQHIFESSKEKKGQSAETNCTYETITSEYIVEYNTVKKTSGRQTDTVSTPLKHDIDTYPIQIEINSLASADSTKVDSDPQYCNVNSDTTQKPNASRQPNFNVTLPTRSEGSYINIHQSPENQNKRNILKNTHPITFDPPTNVNIALSDNETSSASPPAQMTAGAGVYAKVGAKNKELKNPYNTLLDNAD
ncbi:unnamed protein product [Lymnaea stagnalis]|uniref:Uncharacterized protein n=1 Tax=Lymnaea stagnalis TaxID=6523 RepID=A0AAV2H4H4_LYMST